VDLTQLEEELVMTEQRDVNKAIMEAIGRREQSASQLKRQEEKRKLNEEKFWNTMVTRREMKNELDKLAGALNETQSNMQLLYIQNHTLLKIITENLNMTEEQVQALSQKVAQDLFGAPEAPTTEEVPNEETSEEASN
jgi:hypothetical protein